MDKVKAFVIEHFEKLLVLIIVIAAITVTRLLGENFLLLNFYYLPALTAGYFLGRRMALLTAIFCILAVSFLAVVNPDAFVARGGKGYLVAFLAGWGGFLILASIAVGTLYEQNKRRIEDLKRAYVGVLEILSKYLEDTDRYTKGHSLRVSEMAMDIAIAMSLPREEVENVRIGGLLHDIGKVEISTGLLKKAADLTVEEKAIMDTHTERGAKLLSSVGSVLKGAIPIVLASHEFFSESTKGKTIPIGARIVLVADSFDAMTSDRPYRKGLPPWQAFDEIEKGAGRQFDPEVVEAFKRVLGTKLEQV
jgi:putative nucleotidyltransferase with HDIG domain